MNLNPIFYILVLGSLVAAASATVQQPDIFPIPDMSFHDLTMRNADKIDNVVQNMLSDREIVSDAQYKITVAYRDSLHDSEYSIDEIGVNKRYQDYLNAAYDVTNAFLYSSPDLQDKIDLMNAKKDLI